MTSQGVLQPAPEALGSMIEANFPSARALPPSAGDGSLPSARPLRAPGRVLRIGLRAHLPAEGALGDRLFDMLCELGELLQLEEVSWKTQLWRARRLQVDPGADSAPRGAELRVVFTPAGSRVTELPARLSWRVAELRSALEELSFGGDIA